MDYIYSQTNSEDQTILAAVPTANGVIESQTNSLNETVLGVVPATLGYIYGELNEKLTIIDRQYTGVNTSSANTTVNNSLNTIQVDVKNSYVEGIVNPIVENAIDELVESLNFDDDPETNTFVTSVDQTDGLISVTKEALHFAGDAPYSASNGIVVNSYLLSQDFVTYKGISSTDPALGVVRVDGEVVLPFSGYLVQYYRTHGSKTAEEEWIGRNAEWFLFNKLNIHDCEVASDADITQSKIHGLRTTDLNSATTANNRGYLDEIDTLISDNTVPQSVEYRIKTKVDSLDYQDTAETHKFVTKVNETDGVISVTRAQPVQADVDGLVDRLVAIENKATAEEEARTSADAALNTRIDNLDYSKTISTGYVPNVISQSDGLINVTERILNQSDVNGLTTRLTNIETAATTESETRSNADAHLLEQIDAIESKTDVVDVVSCYDRGQDTSKTDIVHYDTTKLHDNDIVKVLQDETKDNAITYYRWSVGLPAGYWTYIGASGPFYTKSETDTHITAAKNEVQGNLNTHTSNTSNPHSVTKAQVGLGNVPNVSTNDLTPTYTEASTLTNISSGEVLSIAFGKIKKAISDLISHLANTSNPHNVTLTQLGVNATATELNYSSGVTSNIQTQINTVAGSIKDSTITILKNGSTVDTFTLNQSTSKSINIPVCKNGTTDPTTSTVADSIGDFYLNTTSKVLYTCSAISGSTYTWNAIKSSGYLGGWNCLTGKPVTDPPSLPYVYNSGDYYKVNNVKLATYTHTVHIQYGTSGTYSDVVINNDSSTAFTNESMQQWLIANGYVDPNYYTNCTGNYEGSVGVAGGSIVGITMYNTTGNTSFLYHVIDESGLHHEYHQRWYFLSVSDNVTTNFNYCPSGSSYTGAASTTLENNDVSVGDMYFYDGTNWNLLNYEKRSNKVVSISSSSTNSQYPSALAVYNYVLSAIVEAIEEEY